MTKGMQKIKSMHHPGIEPRAQRWQRWILPLNQWCLSYKIQIKTGFNTTVWMKASEERELWLVSPSSLRSLVELRRLRISFVAKMPSNILHDLQWNFAVFFSLVTQPARWADFLFPSRQTFLSFKASRLTRTLFFFFSHAIALVKIVVQTAISNLAKARLEHCKHSVH